MRLDPSFPRRQVETMTSIVARILFHMKTPGFSTCMVSGSPPSAKTRHGGLVEPQRSALLCLIKCVLEKVYQTVVRVLAERVMQAQITVDTHSVSGHDVRLSGFYEPIVFQRQSDSCALIEGS